MLYLYLWQCVYVTSRQILYYQTVINLRRNLLCNVLCVKELTRRPQHTIIQQFTAQWYSFVGPMCRIQQPCFYRSLDFYLYSWAFSKIHSPKHTLLQHNTASASKHRSTSASRIGGNGNKNPTSNDLVYSKIGLVISYTVYILNVNTRELGIIHLLKFIAGRMYKGRH